MKYIRTKWSIVAMASFYSPAQPRQSFSDKAVHFDHDSLPRRNLRPVWLAVVMVVVLAAIGSTGWYRAGQVVAPPVEKPEILGQASASATPEPVVGRSLGDILNERPSFTGWLAGVEGGSVVLVQPQNGSINKLVSAPNAWYGPISEMVWSPDHTKLAYLTLTEAEAKALAKDASGYAKEYGLDQIPTPATFPFGKVTILDVATKQVTQTEVEVRNTPKSIVWLDSATVATVGQTLVKYDLTSGKTATLAGGGNTSASEQLQSPLVFDATQQILYFTKVKQAEDGQTVRLVMVLHLKTNELVELQVLKTGTFADVTTSQGVDMALSADGHKLALADETGLSYLLLTDGSLHQLPYKDDLTWLRQSRLSGLLWLSADSVGFRSMAKDGSLVWGGWYIPTDTVSTIAKDCLAGSWDVASGRLAVIEPDGQAVGILTPNWDDTANSQLQTMPLTWSQLSW